MIAGNARNAAAWLAVTMCAAAGGWYGLVRPLATELDEVRHQVAADRAEIEAVESLPQNPGTVEEKSEALSRIASAVNEQLSLGADGAALYDRIVRLAERAGVRVDQIDPRSVGGRSRDDEVVSRVGYQIRASGEFDAVAEFVRLMQFESGQTAVSSVRMHSGAGRQQGEVTATLQTQHFQFASQIGLPELTAGAGSGDTP